MRLSIFHTLRSRWDFEFRKAFWSGPIPREYFVYKGAHLTVESPQSFTLVVLRPPAVVTEARSARRSPAASLTAPHERFALAVYLTAVAILMSSPTRLSAQPSSTNILTARVGHPVLLYVEGSFL